MDRTKTTTIYNLLAQEVEKKIKGYYGLDRITSATFDKYFDSQGIKKTMTYRSFSRVVSLDVATPDQESIITYLNVMGLENIEDFKELTTKVKREPEKTEVILTRPNYYLPKPKSKKKLIWGSLILVVLATTGFVFFTQFYSSDNTEESSNSSEEVSSPLSEKINQKDANTDSTLDAQINSDGGDIFYNNKGTINIEENHIENQTNHYGEE